MKVSLTLYLLASAAGNKLPRSLEYEDNQAEKQELMVSYAFTFIKLTCFQEHQAKNDAMLSTI